MGYAIELSTDSRKPSKLTIDTTARRQQAEDYMCDMQYFTHEIEGKKRKILRFDSIQVVIFSQENLDSMLEYIRNIRNSREIYIDCIYRDDSTSDLLYASPKYLRRMNKQMIKSLKKEMINKIVKDVDEIAIRGALNIQSSK
tara:strand:- start:2220 stop:2645 length:426 start_codon:yes stop_codon:yes gene_type:complete